MNLTFWQTATLGLGTAIFIAIVVIAAVEVAMSRRLKEYRALLLQALDQTVARSAESQAREALQLAEKALSLGYENQADMAKMKEWQSGVDNLAVIRASRGVK